MKGLPKVYQQKSQTTFHVISDLEVCFKQQTKTVQLLSPAFLMGFSDNNVTEGS